MTDTPKSVTDTPERWWEHSQPAPDLKPTFDHGVGEGFGLSSEVASLRIRFPWWDGPAEARHLVRWLKEAQEGDTFCDLDQGWQIDVLLRAGRFHFLDRDFDTGEVLANAAVDRAPFLQALTAAEEAEPE